MTQRKETILYTALRLFAENGIHSTSTKIISKEAKVSEGLIFKHFTNKESLLMEVIMSCVNKINVLLNRIELTEDPKSALKQILNLPFELDPNNSIEWKLVLQIRKINKYHSSIENRLKGLLIKVFNQLHYKYPELETELVLIQFFGILDRLFSHSLECHSELNKLLLNKYHLNSE